MLNLILRLLFGRCRARFFTITDSFQCDRHVEHTGQHWVKEGGTAIYWSNDPAGGKDWSTTSERRC